MWFDGWSGVARVLVSGLAAYAALIFLLRVSGKRTLSKLNAFDLVVTVALGSTLASVLLSQDVPLSEGITAFAVLIFGQYVIAWLAARSDSVSQAVKSQPSIVLWQGQVLDDVIRRERVTRSELESVVRGAGLTDLKQAEAVVLETDGSFHVMASRGGDGSALPRLPDTPTGGCAQPERP